MPDPPFDSPSIDAPDPASSRASTTWDDDPVAAYKRLLQQFLDRRPSGTRQKIAAAIGRHKSFVSQITNPAYPTPVPARHLPTLFRICHFSPEERAAVLAAYLEAHPNQAQLLVSATAPAGATRILHIEVPELGDPERQHRLEELVRTFVEGVAALLAKTDP